MQSRALQAQLLFITPEDAMQGPHLWTESMPSVPVAIEVTGVGGICAQIVCSLHWLYWPGACLTRVWDWDHLKVGGEAER